jgi:exodeoxyribonuclease V beta subunit
MNTPPQDFAQAFGRPDFPLDGVHLVAASAGTGKTWNIGNLYARLLMARGLGVERLLVVTFTDAATRELRDRLRRLLGALQAVFRECANPVDKETDQARLLVSLLPPDDDARRRAVQAVNTALAEFDRAAISTIHAFCGRALRRYAFESGLAFDAEPPAAVRDAQLAAAARDWWRRNVALAPGGAEAAAPGFAFTDLLGALQTISRPGIQPDPDLDDSTPAARALRVAFDLQARWDAARPDRRTPDFDDILLGMRDALRGPRRDAFAAALRAEYAAVLVDEFQDTDPVQYAIFRDAFLDAPDAPPVYFIGDPKQAIYAFRGGDIHAYRAAAAAVPSDRRYSLGENHRSAPGLVAAVNDLFRDPGGDGSGAWTFGDPAIPYPGDIRAGGGKADLADGAPAIQFAELPDGTAEADATAAEIAALLAARPELHEAEKHARPLAPGDIAVLVRAGIQYKGPAIAACLRARGIPAVILDKKHSVFQTAEAEAFRLLLAAFANPAHAATIRAALLTPFFGLSAADCTILARPDGALPLAPDPSTSRPQGAPPTCHSSLVTRHSPVGRYPFLSRRADPTAPATMTDFLRAFREWAALWHDRGFLAAFARMESDLAFRPRIAAQPDGERALVNILHLSELIHAHVGATAALPAAALDWYLRRAAPDAGDESCLRLESDSAAVQILTLHSSKGLEYPVTLIPDAWWRKGGKNGNTGAAWHIFHDSGGTLCVGTSQTATDREAVEQDDEEMRLLYVGLTRAAYRCIVLAPADSSKIHNDAFTTLLSHARTLDLVRPAHTGSAGGPPAIPFTNPSASFLPPPTPPSLPPPHGRGSYSSLSPTADDHASSDPRDLDPAATTDAVSPAAPPTEPPSTHPIFDFPPGTALGSCWHEIFEEADFRAPDADLRPLVTKKLLSAGLLNGSADARAARTDTVLAMVRATLDLPLDDPGGGTFRLRDIPWSDRASEWEFDFSSRSAADTTAALRDILRAHWGGEPADSDHRAFLRTLDRWDRPIPKGFLMGYVDLLFRRGGRYYIVDWKSNVLGRRESAFSPAGLRDEMAAHAYFLQYLVYSAVLHRHLRDTLPGYDWTAHFGGIRYIFLRGATLGRTAIYSDRPSAPLLDALATALGLP